MEAVEAIKIFYELLTQQPAHVRSSAVPTRAEAPPIVESYAMAEISDTTVDPWVLVSNSRASHPSYEHQRPRYVPPCVPGLQPSPAPDSIEQLRQAYPRAPRNSPASTSPRSSTSVLPRHRRPLAYRALAFTVNSFTQLMAPTPRRQDEMRRRMWEPVWDIVTGNGVLDEMHLAESVYRQMQTDGHVCDLVEVELVDSECNGFVEVFENGANGSTVTLRGSTDGLEGSCESLHFLENWFGEGREGAGGC